ncbi:hypothetical protein HanXRQr2_Chr13g0597701 [Helianthus annuus]|uniref:Uncharacterized protein n=1 Tax=Helianthus annuus TaxID=4232 RepID=A0A9K3EI99_HELAN|nr:hypothetical protein HanXRQr2_Chr13g0597701 [Helianthus annuus]KAJ0850022.1 hypothetical protein HanPSC8_Chr13g0575771 [Helianthus annuus]
MKLLSRDTCIVQPLLPDSHSTTKRARTPETPEPKLNHKLINPTASILNAFLICSEYLMSPLDRLSSVFSSGLTISNFLIPKANVRALNNR